MAVDLAGALGDVFWDLPPWITYMPGSDIGCVIFVANPTDVVREYALMSYLSSEGAVISEESVTVFGHSWFKVDPGGFVRLHGAFRFENTNVTLILSLIERESDEETDAVSTFLAQPAAPLWPQWPEGPGVQEPGILPDGGFMELLMIMITMGMVFRMARTPKEEEERKPLPAGRGE
ncbi:hypothetical protein M1O12_00380 [Dehalococcoidia bacterium]|nr:hypothetical protein [Dehalococcoidia bacterium]